MTDDCYIIKETTLYSAFTRMEKNGYLESFPGYADNGKRRTYYRITEKGHQYYSEKCVSNGNLLNADRAFHKKGLIMETIHNYLESMFARLPNTQEVIRRKCELGQMMEDKYSELIEAGKSDNEAVAQVTAEFGKLKESVSDVHGISHILHGDNVYADNIRQITENEVHLHIYDAAFCGLLRGIGIFLAIICQSGPILAATYHASSAKKVR